jgi:ATP-dependent exoDNAse (exonuclease V) beta subunit
MREIFDNNIKLIEATHEYKLKDDPEFKFTSCTTFAKYFFPPFDKIGIANNLTTTNDNYLHLTPQELVSEWDKIAEEGTLIHSEIENYINEKEKASHPKSKMAIEWIKEDVIAIERYDIYSEVIVYSKELELAGTIDLLIYDKMKDEYKILDWKTNRRIETQSYGNKMGNHEATGHIMDCNYYHYSLQLSLYRYILENYYGVRVSGAAICHLTNSRPQFYKTHYHEETVKQMLLADREKLKTKSDNLLTKDFE